MKMNAFRNFSCFVTFGLVLCGSVAYAAAITGTVTNKTIGKPSAGDTVALVDIQAGMADVATTTTDAHGHYSLQSSGSGAYLVRVNHQGGNYFIAAPQGGIPGDLAVYDVAAKLDGVAIDADMILPEAAGGMVRVQERYLVRNTSLPPRAQFSSNTFEFVLPANAVLDGASATRPGGMATNTRPIPLAEKNHFTINIPIQPNQGEKETLFEVQYHLSYNGDLKLTPQPQMPTDNLVVYLPKGMNFVGAKGAEFQPAQEDPRVQTFVAKNIHPGQKIEFTVSGEGQMPREPQSAGIGQPISGGMGDTGAGDTTSRPGGGIGNPIGTPDPLTRYKWWILGILTVLLVAAAAFLLRKSGASLAGSPFHASHGAFEAGTASVTAQTPGLSLNQVAAPAAGNTALLYSLKEQLFDLEKDKLSGAISQAEYTETRAGLEAVLKRAIRKG
jgi:hypothetical protein